MAEASAVVSKVKPGAIIFGLVLTAATFFVIGWGTGKGWKLGTK